MSEWSDSDLRTTFQGLAADLAGSKTELDAEHIGAVARGDVTDGDLVRAVIDRCSSDPEVAEVWRLAVALADEAPTETAPVHNIGGGDGDRAAGSAPQDATSDAPREPTQAQNGEWVRERFADNVVPLFRHRAVWAVLALAALALLAIGLGGLGSDPDPTYRGSAGVGGSISPATTSVQAGQPAQLTWHLSDAVRWRLVVSDAGLATIHRAEPVGGRYVLPGSVTEGRAGEQLLWRVEAVRANGSVESTPTFTLSVR